MIKRAEIDTSNLNRSEQPYTETAILRETSYQFDAGMPMFLLMAPDDAVYAMQSYSLQVDPELGYDDLATLADRLSLPEGWSYKVAVPETDYVASARGEARVIQDDLMNSYQKIGTLPASLVLQ